MARFDELTWEEFNALDRDKVVAILPLGAIEAHGPHLPLNTDVIIAEAMAESAAELLQRDGVTALVLPTLVYSAASFAAAFPGTLSMRPAVVTASIVDTARSLARAGVRTLALANSHFDPVHLGSIRGALDRLEASTPDDPGYANIDVVFPDVTRKPWALELTDEFRSGACHAGQYEGSIVMAARPESVRVDVQGQLADNPTSLSTAIRDGKTSFAAAGGPRAYFGYPSKASAQEGHETIAVLGSVLQHAVLEARSKQTEPSVDG